MSTRPFCFTLLVCFLSDIPIGIKFESFKSHWWSFTPWIEPEDEILLALNTCENEETDSPTLGVPTRWQFVCFTWREISQSQREFAPMACFKYYFTGSWRPPLNKVIICIDKVYFQLVKSCEKHAYAKSASCSYFKVSSFSSVHCHSVKNYPFELVLRSDFRFEISLVLERKQSGQRMPRKGHKFC